METPTMTATRIDRGSTPTTTIYSEGGDLVFERTFDAPRERVWKAFTDPEIVPRWWGPHGTTTQDRRDGRPAGRQVALRQQRSRSRRCRVLRRVPDGHAARGLRMDVHVRCRGRRPAGRPGDRTGSRTSAGRPRSSPSATWARPRRSKAHWRPGWPRARSRPGTASRPSWPRAERSEKGRASLVGGPAFRSVR